MKKSFLRMTLVATTAALIAVGCTDDSGSTNKSSEVGEFVTMFVGGGAQYTLSVDVSPIGGGTVTREPNNTTYKAGSKVTVTAEESEGYTFTGWSGASNDKNATITVTMNGDISLTANFRQSTYTLSVNASPTQGGTVSREPQNNTYIYGENVAITATQASGYTFTHWTITSGNGTISNATNASTYVTMNGDATVTANFTQNPTYTLTVGWSPSSGGSASASQTTNISAGTQVNITATEASGYTFKNWTITSGNGTIANASSPSTYVTVNWNVTVTANFVGCFTDGRDGRTYKTVVIGHQRWVAENLNYQTTESWCYENSSANCVKYGRMYTWAAAKTVCPSGWRLPTLADWEALAEAVGGTKYTGDIPSWYDAGNYLKSQTGWNSYSGIVNSDTYGFSALPGGYSYSDSRFNDDAGYSGYWWTATENDAGEVYYLCMVYNGDRLHEGNMIIKYNKSVGLSVRCFRDE